MLEQFGQEIDKHQFVLRLNDGPVDGFEKFVGSKRSLRFGWNSTYHPNESYIECSSTRPVPTWGTTWLIECDQQHLTGMLHNLSGGVGQGGINKATTGARALVMAMSNCAEVHAYGFFQITSDVRRKLKFHYYGEGAKKPYEANNRVHTTWDSEHNLWPQLAEPGTEMQERGKMVIPGLPMITNCSPEAMASVPTYLARHGGGARSSRGAAAAARAPAPAAAKAPTTTTRRQNATGSARPRRRKGRREALDGFLRSGWANGFAAGALSATGVAMAIALHGRYLGGGSQRATCMISLLAGAGVTIMASFLSMQRLTVLSAGTTE